MSPLGRLLLLACHVNSHSAWARRARGWRSRFKTEAERQGPDFQGPLFRATV